MSDLQASAMVALRAELAKKQVDFRLKKLGVPETLLAKPTTKKIPAQNKGVSERSKKDLQVVEDRQPLELSAKMLRQKAEIYERLSKRQLTEEEQEKYLVDFEKKELDEIDAQAARRSRRSPTPPPASADDEWVTFVDALGRERRCLRKDLSKYKEMDRDIRRPDPERSPAEGNSFSEEPAAPVGPVHYQMRRAEDKELRQLGVGYFQFSTDEESRQQELAALNKLREDTLIQRERQENLKKRRQEQAAERLKKIKMRKEGVLSKDLPVEEPPAPPEEEEPSAPFQDVEGMLDYYHKLADHILPPLS